MQRIACVSQKGGVGKSTLARDIAIQFAANGWRVNIADMDERQTTVLTWEAKRNKAGFSPEVGVFGCATVDSALKVGGCDLVVFDGKPYSSTETRRVAEASDLIVIPSGPTTDDLDPQILLAHELTKVRVTKDRILFVINSIVTEVDGTEAREARAYVQAAGYRVAEQVILRRPSYGQAHNIGKSISEVAAPSLRAHAISVVTEIGSILNQESKAA